MPATITLDFDNATGKDFKDLKKSFEDASKDSRKMQKAVDKATDSLSVLTKEGIKAGKVSTDFDRLAISMREVADGSEVVTDNVSIMRNNIQEVGDSTVTMSSEMVRANEDINRGLMQINESLREQISATNQLSGGQRGLSIQTQQLAVDQRDTRAGMADVLIVLIKLVAKLLFFRAVIKGTIALWKLFRKEIKGGARNLARFTIQMTKATVLFSPLVIGIGSLVLAIVAVSAAVGAMTAGIKRMAQSGDTEFQNMHESIQNVGRAWDFMIDRIVNAELFRTAARQFTAFLDELTGAIASPTKSLDQLKAIGQQTFEGMVSMIPKVEVKLFGLRLGTKQLVEELEDISIFDKDAIERGRKLNEEGRRRLRQHEQEKILKQALEELDKTSIDLIAQSSVQRIDDLDTINTMIRDQSVQLKNLADGRIDNDKAIIKGKEKLIQLIRRQHQIEIENERNIRREISETARQEMQLQLDIFKARQAFIVAIDLLEKDRQKQRLDVRLEQNRIIKDLLKNEIADRAGFLKKAAIEEDVIRKQVHDNRIERIRRQRKLNEESIEKERKLRIELAHEISSEENRLLEIKRTNLNADIKNRREQVNEFKAVLAERLRFEQEGRRLQLERIQEFHQHEIEMAKEAHARQVEMLKDRIETMKDLLTERIDDGAQSAIERLRSSISRPDLVRGVAEARTSQAQQEFKEGRGRDLVDRANQGDRRAAAELQRRLDQIARNINRQVASQERQGLINPDEIAKVQNQLTNKIIDQLAESGRFNKGQAEALRQANQQAEHDARTQKEHSMLLENLDKSIQQIKEVNRPIQEVVKQIADILKKSDRPENKVQEQATPKLPEESITGIEESRKRIEEATNRMVKDIESQKISPVNQAEIDESIPPELRRIDRGRRRGSVERRGRISFSDLAPDPTPGRDAIERAKRGMKGIDRAVDRVESDIAKEIPGAIDRARKEINRAVPEIEESIRKLPETIDKVRGKIERLPPGVRRGPERKPDFSRGPIPEGARKTDGLSSAIERESTSGTKLANSTSNMMDSATTAISKNAENNELLAQRMDVIADRLDSITDRSKGMRKRSQRATRGG